MEFAPKAFTAPAPDVGVDAVIFTFAWERTQTVPALIRRNTFGLWVMPIGVIADLVVVGNPNSAFLHDVTRREVCLGICMVDCRTGEILWSDVETSYGLIKLEDPETARKLVGKAYRKLSNHMKIVSTK